MEFDSIPSSECWFYDKCLKYSNGECKLDNSYCQKLFRENLHIKQSLLSDKQKKVIPLYADADGTDLSEFQQLSLINKNIEQFVTEGHNLYLYSPYAGNGKTSWSIKLLLSYIDKIWYKTLDCKTLFIHVPKFFQELKSSISSPNEYISHIKVHINDADVVVWDDIATKVSTDYELEVLLSYISTRIDLQKSNIYTSNIVPQELNTMLGGRLYSRIVNMSEVIGLNGSDKRGLNR